MDTILSDRQNNIISKIQNAKERYQQVQNQLNQARSILLEAKIKDAEIRSMSDLEIEKEKKALKEALEEITQRFEDGKQASMQIQREKIREQICLTMFQLSFARAKDSLQNSVTINSGIQIDIVNYLLRTLNCVS